MTVERLLIEAKKKVHSDYAKMIISDMLNINSLELFNYLNDEKDENFCNTYFSKIEMIANNKPVQYVIGNVNFYGLNLEVNDKVLIPRFETEELVENTLNLIKEHFDNDKLDIIDLGCGSGVIGLTLEQKVSTNSVDLIDISENALEVTKINKDNLNSKANLIQSDMFENITKKYDVIISNPPYIKTTEEIEDIVLNNEPHLALFAGVDGLDCYKKIINNLSNHMKDRCLVAFEIGMTQAQDITNIAKEVLGNIKIEVKKDLSDKDRMLFIFKNLE